MAMNEKKLRDKFDAFLSVKDTYVFYKNVISVYVQNTKISQSIRYENCNNEKSKNHNVYVKLYMRMVKAYEKLSIELHDYEPMLQMSNSNSVENDYLTLYMQEIAERYRPLPELEVFSDKEQSIIQMRKFEKKQLHSVKMGKKWINNDERNVTRQLESRLIVTSSDSNDESSDDDITQYQTTNSEHGNDLIVLSSSDDDNIDDDDNNTNNTTKKLQKTNILQI